MIKITPTTTLSSPNTGIGSTPIMSQFLNS